MLFCSSINYSTQHHISGGAAVWRPAARDRTALQLHQRERGSPTPFRQVVPREGRDLQIHAWTAGKQKKSYIFFSMVHLKIWSTIIYFGQYF